MSGGLLDALERLNQGDVAEAVAGYRYFGLDSAASVIEAVGQELAASDPENSPGTYDELETAADARYAAAVADDSTIFRAFQDRLQQTREAFAPLP